VSAALRSTLSLLFTFFGSVMGWIIGTDLIIDYGIHDQTTVEVAGACLGALMGIMVSIPVAQFLETSITNIMRHLEKLTLAEIVVGTVGLIVGLVVSFLCSLPLVALPQLMPSLKIYAPLLIVAETLLWSVLGAFLGARLGRSAEIVRLFGIATAVTAPVSTATSKILDTSVIIDGRLADVCKSGFLEGTLVVPEFVLAELQRLADSADGLKRARGRRGLEMLEALRKEYPIEVRDCPTTGPLDVDAHLLRMAGDLPGQLVTTDYNLNKVASVRGIKVLNLNELVNALRPAVIPGEAISVRVMRDGKERGQGVGYLPDGTMIVVEDGHALIGQEVSVEVTGVRQTVAGKMIFARAHASMPTPTAARTGSVGASPSGQAAAAGRAGSVPPSSPSPGSASPSSTTRAQGP
jgi:uncharacterized protein YacL